MSLETLVVAIGPTEESRIEALTDAVVDVAAPSDATVVLYHAFSERAFERGVRGAALDDEDATSDDTDPTPADVASRLESVVAMTARLDDVGIEYEVRSGVEPAADGILRVTADLDADVVFVGGRKRSSTGKAVFGSVAHRVLMNAPCPVTFVRESVGGQDHD